MAHIQHIKLSNKRPSHKYKVNFSNLFESCQNILVNGPADFAALQPPGFVIGGVDLVPLLPSLQCKRHEMQEGRGAEECGGDPESVAVVTP